MLIKLKEQDFDKYIDFAYALALDLTKSGYPTYTDGIKTREDFIRQSRRAFTNELQSAGGSGVERGQAYWQ